MAKKANKPTKAKAKATKVTPAPEPEEPTNGHVQEAAPPHPLRLEWIDPADLSANPRNWRRHPKKQLDSLSGVMAEVGWAGVLLFNESTGRLVDGHARKELFSGQLAPVLVGSWSEAQEEKILATLDPIAAMATADANALEGLLRTVQTGNESVASMLEGLAKENGLLAGLNAPGPTEIDEPWIDEDALDAQFAAPFPWFGAKSRVAAQVWKRFGDVPNYIEPFFGSGAMLLGRPGWKPDSSWVETVNDYDGLVCNFWRALKAEPDKVAEFADYPVLENDLHARHAFIVGQKDSLQEKLEGDPEYFDVKIAGWWVWGMACWIGSEFCSGKGPWVVQDGRLVKGGEDRGVSRQLVHLGDAGRGKPGTGECGLLAWMQALAERLRRVRVCCGDWTRICGGSKGDALHHFFHSGDLCGVFLDPPYADTAGRDSNIYRVDSESVAHAVREWAIRHGNDKRLRIALCGYEGEHAMPESWEQVSWKAQGGYGNLNEESTGRDNSVRERLWFSPHCLRKGEQPCQPEGQ